jgi:hypothetical protein
LGSMASRVGIEPEAAIMPNRALFALLDRDR